MNGVIPARTGQLSYRIPDAGGASSYCYNYLIIKLPRRPFEHRGSDILEITNHFSALPRLAISMDAFLELPSILLIIKLMPNDETSRIALVPLLVFKWYVTLWNLMRHKKYYLVSLITYRKVPARFIFGSMTRFGKCKSSRVDPEDLHEHTLHKVVCLE